MSAPDLAVLRQVSQRVLWLSAAIVDAANRGRGDAGGIKVGTLAVATALVASSRACRWTSTRCGR